MNIEKLTRPMDRDKFRNAVFARDKNKCVTCKADGQDAHHIVERRLFGAEGNWGYFLDNGATLCGDCHIKAEQTVLSCEEIREAAGIENIVLPSHLYPDETYDKWANVILPSGQRMRGELFDDESVQKILAPVLYLFTKYVKYPRTYHFPFSPGRTKDDRVLESTDIFEGKKVVVSLKADGENTSCYNDHMHARSLDSKSDETRHWMQNLHSKIAYNIPEGWRVCLENVFAKHSIFYKNLPSYALMFSVWNEKNFCLSWKDTQEWADLLGLNLVPVLYEGVYDEEKIKSLFQPEYEGNEMEGYVVRLADSFHYRDFRKSVGKYVREGHITTSHTWRRAAIVKNELKDDES